VVEEIYSDARAGMSSGARKVLVAMQAITWSNGFAKLDRPLVEFTLVTRSILHPRRRRINKQK